jgi:hypothetical protein
MVQGLKDFVKLSLVEQADYLGHGRYYTIYLAISLEHLTITTALQPLIGDLDDGPVPTLARHGCYLLFRAWSLLVRAVCYCLTVFKCGITLSFSQKTCFVLFCFNSNADRGLKGLCRTKKTQIPSSWTKPPVEAPQFRLPLIFTKN